ncbi:hypothetical protein OGAPHI_000205 [Ogataea philodendri]|uniref:Uncharacterized protein n=1 Tax=Ogataea philodendri TaxID=1378263 RepID=A0A9P8PHR6_9ASCO|nr:uncharacterized protein OGAPHI_000205 [Ogataea philodendri]KAH3671502.1 hypothetical protein OGAPHI_000205 [Ogataea philodendri]
MRLLSKTRPRFSIESESWISDRALKEDPNSVISGPISEKCLTRRLFVFEMLSRTASYLVNFFSNLTKFSNCSSPASSGNMLKLEAAGNGSVRKSLKFVSGSKKVRKYRHVLIWGKAMHRFRNTASIRLRYSIKFNGSLEACDSLAVGKCDSMFLVVVVKLDARVCFSGMGGTRTVGKILIRQVRSVSNSLYRLFTVNGPTLMV